MSSSAAASSQSTAHAAQSASASPLPSTSASGAVPAQLPVRSYANATKTATPPTSAGASAPAQNAKPASDNQMNGTAAQGGSQPTNANGDHGRKPSVVINASGIAGQYPNGGPVQNGTGRPNINFGSMGPSGDSQPNAPFQQQSASLQAARHDPRVTSPAHSPSPIPQPAASGGRPPSSIASQGNGGLAFGSLPADTEIMRGQGPQAVPIHERRTSSQSMQSEVSNPGVNMARQAFPPGSGRGRGYAPQQQQTAQFMGSPAQNYRMPNPQARSNMPPQFNQPGGPPGSPFRQNARASPVPMQAQPHMPGHMGGNPQMHYQYAQHLNPSQQQAMYSMPPYDPSAGYYNPYYYPGYGPQPPQSPRPQYPSPFPGQPGGPMQAPYHPPGTPSMARTPSQASERPPSSLGHPQTPAQNPPAPSQTPGTAQQSNTASSNFVRPKKTNAIKITDSQGNAINFGNAKPTTPSVQPQTPVIVSTPNAPTPPPRVPSTQHNRVESKSVKSSEETKNAFAEQVKRQLEENKRKEQEAADAAKKVKDTSDAKEKEVAEKELAAQEESQKAADAAAEEASAKVAADKKAEEDAAAAQKEKDVEEEKKRKEKEEEDERLEREIAEMEALEREEEERERAYQEKKAKEKAASATKEAERAKNADDELKRQEREAEERENAKEREREAGEHTKDEPDDDAKSLFASLKKPTLGPGASAPASGTETPNSEATADSTTETDAAASSMAPPPARSSAQKPKPAHLKLETNKPVERAEPTPGMQALKSARFLEIKEEARYPDGFSSPNPALNQTGARQGRAYDKSFLLQFQNVFKEKPTVDWDQKVKETLGPGDEPGSARAGSARTPSGAMSRGGSGRPGSSMPVGGAMGQFSGPMGGRTLPPGTSSEQRFQASMGAGGAQPRPGMPGVNRTPSSLGMGAPGVGMSRTNSLQMMNMGPNSPRQPSSRGGKGGSKRDDRQKSRREESDMANKMPLTAHMSIAPLEKSQTGWKPTVIGGPMASAPDPSGNMAPDMVQRKVKAALNKMTPEKFEKISDQILEIAAQSKNESDGRTLRQVIQLTFEKACDEAHWAGMYAKFCHKMLTAMNPEIRDETIKDKSGNPVVGGALFRKYLLNRCQEEFEHGWQANLPDKPEGESQEAVLLSDEYYIAAAAKRRGLGLIQFIGQLYKLRMLTLRIMHECVMRLLNFEGDPDEAAVENLTTLLKAIGATMEEDEQQGRGLMNTYFQRIEDVIIKSDALPSRPKFMIMDLMDLRRAGWKGKDDAKGPKTITQIHAEAAAAQAKDEAERQRTQRGGGGRPPAGRGDARNFSGNMAPPVDYARTNVNMDDLRKLQQRGAARQTGGSLGPGGGLGPSLLGARSGSRRGAGNLGPGSSGTSRTNTPPVDGKKEEPATAQNAFSALASLDPEAPIDAQSQSEAASPPAARNRSKSPLADESNA